MACECPDSRFFQDMADLNREFLTLLTGQGQTRGEALLGLKPAWVEMLCALSDDQLASIARTPCLLACFGVRLNTIGETPSVFQSSDPVWCESVRMFSVALMSFLRTTLQQDSLHAALCLGREHDSPVSLADVPLGGINGRAAQAAGTLRARLAEAPFFWPDLIRAARSEDTEFRRLSRLTAIPLFVTSVATSQNRGN